MFGPALEARIAIIHMSGFRACELWEMLHDFASNDFEVRVTLDWNGINARAWDMSFVPWRPMDYVEMVDTNGTDE